MHTLHAKDKEFRRDLLFCWKTEKIHYTSLFLTATLQNFTDVNVFRSFNILSAIFIYQQG